MNSTCPDYRDLESSWRYIALISTLYIIFFLDSFAAFMEFIDVTELLSHNQLQKMELMPLIRLRHSHFVSLQLQPKILGQNALLGKVDLGQYTKGN